MTDTTLPGVLLHGTAAARPAANAVAKGTVYSATDTGAITQSDGVSTWSTWATISSGGSGSITASGYTQNTAKLLGRTTGSSGAIEEISVGTGLSLSAGSLTASGSAGALVFLEAHTASSSASLDFTTFISSTYDTYLLYAVGIVPASNAVDLNVEIGTGGGPTYDTGSNYEWGAAGMRSDAVAFTNAGSTGVAKLFNSMSNTAGYGFGTASLSATNLQSTALRKIIQGTGQFVTSAPANAFFNWGMSWNTTATAVTALRFIMSSGNIASGIIRIYGVSKT
jgi:hypothetical protein